MIRLLVSAVLLTAAPATSAQLSNPATSISLPTPSTYAGHYATDGGSIEVQDAPAGLALIAYGTPVAARLASLADPDVATASRTAALLDAWIVGDIATVAAAARPDRQTEAARAFSAYRAALVRGWGAPVSTRIVGTFRLVDGRRATLAHLVFERGSEWTSFVWDDAGALATVTRGLGPVTLGALRPVGHDAFDATGVAVTFDREADGRVYRVDVADRVTAVR